MVKKANAFTIVELLIVIVVIAILAAISIVAYRGIQDRANSSSAQAAARQAATKIQIAFTENDEYPEVASLAALGINDSTSTTYQYDVDNNASPKTYCITASTGNKSFYVSNNATTPTAGGCVGHGQNGQQAITNLVVNPSFETSLGSYNVGEHGARSLVTGDAFSGNSFMRFQTTTNRASTSAVGPYTTRMNVKPDTPYTAIAYIRSNVPVRVTFNAERRRSNDTSIGNINQGQIDVGTGWTRAILSVPATPELGKITLTLYTTTRNWVVGDTIDYDAMMLVEGNLNLNYADGNSPNWKWNGAQNASTSTGPAL